MQIPFSTMLSPGILGKYISAPGGRGRAQRCPGTDGPGASPTKAALRCPSATSHPTLWRARCLTVLTILVTLAGCGKSDQPAGPAEEDAAASGSREKVFTIGMSQCNLGEPWRVQMDADIKAAAAKHPNLKVIFKNAQNDSLRQRSHVEEFVSAGVDLIIISPKEAQPLTKPVKQAYQAGIPVIVLDRAVIGDQYTCFIGANNKKIGHAAGLWLAKALEGKGKIVELKGLMTSTPGQDRHSGFRDALKDYPDIRILFESDMQWLEPNARNSPPPLCITSEGPLS